MAFYLQTLGNRRYNTLRQGIHTVHERFQFHVYCGRIHFLENIASHGIAERCWNMHETLKSIKFRCWTKLDKTTKQNRPSSYTFKCFICAQRWKSRWLPFVFKLAASLRDESNRTVAAECSTMFTVSESKMRSSSWRPTDGSDISPDRHTSLCSSNSSSLRMFSKIWNDIRYKYYIIWLYFFHTNKFLMRSNYKYDGKEDQLLYIIITIFVFNVCILHTFYKNFYYN